MMLPSVIEPLVARPAVLQHVLAGRAGELPGLADDLLTSVLMLDVDPQQLSPGASHPLEHDGADRQPPS
jgi:hypothetical protein